MTFQTTYMTTDQTDSVAPAVRTMTKCAEQCRADTGVANWMAGRSRRPQQENTDNILSWQATARTSLRKRKSGNNSFTVVDAFIFIHISKLELELMIWNVNKLKHKRQAATHHLSWASYLLPAAVSTELGSSVFQSRPSLEHRSWLSFEPATTDTSFSTSRNIDGSMLTYTQTYFYSFLGL